MEYASQSSNVVPFPVLKRRLLVAGEKATRLARDQMRDALFEYVGGGDWAAMCPARIIETTRADYLNVLESFVLPEFKAESLAQAAELKGGTRFLAIGHPIDRDRRIRRTIWPTSERHILRAFPDYRSGDAVEDIFEVDTL